MSGFISDPGLRSRLSAGVPVIGAFVKTTSHQIVEVLGRSGLDFVVLDAEHAPFGVDNLDRVIGAAAAAGAPALVRIPDHSASFVNSCLDMGASGVLVPHTVTAEHAAAIADAMKYGRGRRGFSPSGRAGNYGQVDFAAYRDQADATSTIWCQIEDVEALDHLDAIASVKEVDCLFIGPADLSISLGLRGPHDPRLSDAVATIIAAGQRHHKAIGLYVFGPEQVADWAAKGVTAFVCGSDQGYMLAGAKRAAQAIADLR